jgi:peroxiredoxin
MFIGVAHAGSARLTAEMVAEYERSVKQWETKLKAAATSEAQVAIWKKRPDAEKFGERIWGQLRTSLRENWILSYAPNFLEEAPAYAVTPHGGKVPSRDLLRAVELFHMKNPQVGRLCLALTILPDPETLKIIRKISESNPSPEVQGQAALAQALLLKHLGDDQDNMKMRLGFLREAIIKSDKVRVGKTTVAELARSEIYAIIKLSKGREAPDLLGRDVAGRPMGLHSMRGKVVVLVFWRSWMPDADRIVAILQRFHREHQGRPVELIGIAGVQAQVLRGLRADGTIPWRNFVDSEGALAKQYQVLRMPQAYVIDAEGKIQFIGSPGTFMDLAVEALLAEGE